MIEVIDAEKKFREAIALNRVTVKFETGRIHGIIGRSELNKEGITILLSSHYAEDIEVLCDTVCELDGGVLTPVN